MNLPSQSLIHNLIERYYGDPLEPQENRYISSHWRHYSNFFKIDLDEEGHLRSLQGAGLGSLKRRRGWKGAVQWLADEISTFTHLCHLPNRREILKLRTMASKQCSAMGLDLTFDAFRQVCTLELLSRYMDRVSYKHRLRVIMIGDGYGLLSALFKKRFKNSTIIMVDMGKTLVFQSYYCQKLYPKHTHRLVEDVDDIDKVDFVYCPTEQLEALEPFRYDMGVSIASMQEMNATTVKRYFAFLRKCLQPKNIFYCCSRESKILPDGEVSEFTAYPWEEGDQFLVDGRCPWHQYFISPAVGIDGLRLFGRRIPFINFYDGKHLHRLAILSTEGG